MADTDRFKNNEDIREIGPNRAGRASPEFMGKQIVPNSRWHGLGPPTMKIPRWLCLDENNVALQFTLATPIAAGATFTLTGTPGRGCVLRRLYISALSGVTDFTVETITAATNNVAPSNTAGTSIPGLAFSPLVQNPFDWDMLIDTTQNVVINGTNRNAGVQTFAAVGLID